MKKKKNFKFLFILFALPLCAEQKIGYIDSQKILSQYQKAQEVKKEFDSKVKEWKNEVSRRQEELEKLQKNLQTQSFMLTEEARLRKIEEMQNKKTELENFINEIYRKDGKAELLNKDLMQPLLQEIDTVVSEIAREEEFSLILDSSTGVVIYADEIYDITSKIIETLNKKYLPAYQGEEKVEYYVFNLKEEDSDSKSRGLGSRIKRLIIAAINDFGGSFKLIQSANLSSAQSSLAIENEEEVSSNVALAVQFLNMSGVNFVIIGRVWVETGNIFFEYSIVDKEKEQAIVTEKVEVGVEENLKDRVAEKVMPQITKLYQ
jgi:outer membrane protein